MSACGHDFKTPPGNIRQLSKGELGSIGFVASGKRGRDHSFQAENRRREQTRRPSGLAHDDDVLKYARQTQSGFVVQVFK